MDLSKRSASTQPLADDMQRRLKMTGRSGKHSRRPNGDVNNNTAATTVDSSTSPGYPYVDMSMYEDYLRPIYKDGDVVLEVECGDNQGLLYLSRLCQGSKGPCIFFNNMWLTPNEFQYVSGRETAKDWKRSIRHHGKSMKLLLSKGILAVHPPICDCDGCRISSPVSRNGRLLDSSKRSLAQMTTDSCAPPSKRVNNGRSASKKSPLRLPASDFSSQMDLSLLIAQTQQQAKELEKCMEINLNGKNDLVNKSSDSVKKKRESLNGIINQILSIKAKEGNKDATKSGSNGVTTPNLPIGYTDTKNDQCNSDVNKASTKSERGSEAMQQEVTGQPTSIIGRSMDSKNGRKIRKKEMRPTKEKDCDYPLSSAASKTPLDERKTVSKNCKDIMTNGGLISTDDSNEINKKCATPDKLLEADKQTLPLNFSTSDTTNYRQQNLLDETQASLLGFNYLPTAALLAGGNGVPSFLKQMEQIVSQNYSNIIRNIAAKYTNFTNNSDRSNHEHAFDGRHPTPPLPGSSKTDVDDVRKNENHSAPPILSEQLSPNSTYLTDSSMMDMSSTQALLTMARSASANVKGRSQFEVNFRNSGKRLMEEENDCIEPLDLSTKKKKKLQLTSEASVSNLNDEAGSGEQVAIKSLRNLGNQAEEKEINNKVDGFSGVTESRSRKQTSPQFKNKTHSSGIKSTNKSNGQDEDIAKWPSENMCKYVSSLDSYLQYVQAFHKQPMDGKTLPLLPQSILLKT